MKIEILPKANKDLAAGFRFYEKQEAGLGAYFLDSVTADIESLRLYAGIHPIRFGAHRCYSQRFPFAIYYVIEDGAVRVQAVLDSRRDPSKARRRLTGR